MEFVTEKEIVWRRSQMVKILSVVFVALFAAAHLVDAHGNAYHRPLSMFRDYEPIWIGYAMFGVLVAIGVESFRAAVRANCGSAMGVYCVVSSWLSIVATTPSDGIWHFVLSVGGMLVLYSYYWCLLYSDGSLILFAVHVVSPVMMIVVTQHESYGSWQKGMILYFLAAIVIHHHLLIQSVTNHHSPRIGRGKKRFSRSENSKGTARTTSGKSGRGTVDWQVVNIDCNDRRTRRST